MQREKPGTMTIPTQCASTCLVLLIWCCPLVAQDGTALYKQHCAACHDQASPSIPSRNALQKMSPRRILRTLDIGVMVSIAYPLRREEREAIANFLGTRSDEAPFAPSAFCSEEQPSLSTR